jgi:hypothetical protein
LGTNGTVASGAATSSTTSTYSDSQSDLESGTEVTADPTGGAALAGTYTQSSPTTSYVYSQNNGNQTYSAGGVVISGDNSFTFIQND